MLSDTRFASCTSDLDDADYVILGVPYDGTSSFRPGSSEAPNSIRKASYCFEPYLSEYDISLRDIAVHDHGDIPPIESELRVNLKNKMEEICPDDKFPIILGGEHSLSPMVVSVMGEMHSDLNVLILDAHLDFRDEYEGMKHSHATVSRRVSEIVGLHRTEVYGVRSKAKDYSDGEQPNIYTSLEDVLQNIKKPTYLSIDMDVVDPAHAPGVGNPEPFGLEPKDIKKLISTASDLLVGMDIVEVCPKYDSSGITSNLAARFVYELLGARESRDV